MSFDCIVIGGGLMGLLSARELAAGGRQVLLVERARTGSESSWAGGGILSPLYPWRYADPVSRLVAWSQARYPVLAKELSDASGVDPEWTLSGLLILGLDEADQACHWASRYQVELEMKDSSELGPLVPGLGTGDWEGGLWLPEVAQVRNPRLMKALHGAAIADDVIIREGLEITAIRRAGRGVALETGSSETLETPLAVVAAGAWTGTLLEPLGLRIPVEPLLGQMLLFKAEEGLLEPILLYRDHYLIPRRDGHLLVGSTLEHTGFNKLTTAEARTELEAIAFQLLPHLADCPLERQWAGLRPASPAGIPYIGEHPDIPGLFVNAGHFRNGVVTGPASARLLADLVLDRSPVLDPTPYRLQRSGSSD